MKSNGCPWHSEGSCGLSANEIARLEYTRHLDPLSDEWCEAMLNDYGVDYRQWYPKPIVELG